MAQAMLEATAGFERQAQSSLALQARAFTVIALNSAGRAEEAQRLWRAAPKEAVDAPSQAACAFVDYMYALRNGPAGTPPKMLWRLVEAVSSSRAALTEKRMRSPM